MKNKNLWAPWRIEYIRTLDPEDRDGGGGCFLCDYWAAPEKDAENLVLWRSGDCMVLFNRFPYTGGHLLIAPGAHVADLDHLGDETMLRMMSLARDAQTALSGAIRPHGFNLGININRCAGAGVPGHIHLHVVPRWDGDTNFMGVTGQVRVISQALEELYQQLAEIGRAENLPRGVGSGGPEAGEA